MGLLAGTLVSWDSPKRGEVLYRQQVEQIEVDAYGRATAVHTKKGLRVEGDQFLQLLNPLGFGKSAG